VCFLPVFSSFRIRVLYLSTFQSRAQFFSSGPRSRYIYIYILLHAMYCHILK
jgi:hypothetical protein